MAITPADATRTREANTRKFGCVGALGSRIHRFGFLWPFRELRLFETYLVSAFYRLDSSLTPTI